MEFDDLLRLMVEHAGSDLFITAGVAPSIKISGRITPVGQQSLTAELSRQLAMALMDSEQRAEFSRHRECNFAIARPGIGRFRVNVFQQRGQVGMVLRRIATTIPNFDQLQLPPILRDLSLTQRGIVLFVGGTGSGKSTSLAAMVDYRNRNSDGHIITIEDPIEFIHEHQRCIVTQREVGIDTDSFDDALINTLRQAPDVILIGEIRHAATMEHAVAFAETGHLCLATLHANNANQALDRIINFFPEERRSQLLMDLSLNLRAVIAQRLIPRSSGSGRRAAVEVLINSPLMSDLIRKGEVQQMKALMQRSGEQGMQSFDQALFQLYQAGEITLEDALRNADSANEVRLLVKLASGGGVEALNEATAELTLQQEDAFDPPSAPL